MVTYRNMSELKAVHQGEAYLSLGDDSGNNIPEAPGRTDRQPNRLESVTEQVLLRWDGPLNLVQELPNPCRFPFLPESKKPHSPVPILPSKRQGFC